MQNEICPFAHGVYCKEDCKLFNRDTKECKLGEKKSDGQFVSILKSDIKYIEGRVNNLELKIQELEAEGKKKKTTASR
ncbi:MAG TPA: hypothetical protein PKJ95_00570 [Atribacterota bacterium]|nr:hypothetical protein [Atribacterota bacterium]